MGHLHLSKQVDIYVVDNRKKDSVVGQPGRLLASPRPTKKAGEDQRIATNKIEHALTRPADLQRAEPKERDSRIFPGYSDPPGGLCIS